MLRRVTYWPAAQKAIDLQSLQRHWPLVSLSAGQPGAGGGGRAMISMAWFFEDRVLVS